jgi:hypothetical protein
VFDPVADAWVALAPLPAYNASGHGGVSHAGIATDASNIYLAGGYSANTAGNGQIFGSVEVYRYNVAANTYTRLPDLPQARAAGGLAYVDGQLHYFGGTNQARNVETPEHWALKLADLAAGWVARAPLPNPRNHLGSAVIDGRLYVVGGQHGQDAPATSQAELDVYDPTTNTWALRAPMPTALSHIAATTVNGQLIVLGGETAYNVNTAITSSYNPATNVWTSLSPLPAARFAGIAGAIAGTIYFAGGSAKKDTYKGTPASPPVAGVRRFNFQPASSAAPAGYTADTGLSYNATRGYGWVREDSLAQATHVGLDLSPNTRDRNLVSDQTLDTFVHMQAPAGGTNVTVHGAWELAVPNGSYDVTVTVGDAAAYYDSDARIRADKPTSATRHASATANVAITDGRLTIDAVGGTNTKVDAVTIVPHVS